MPLCEQFQILNSTKVLITSYIHVNGNHRILGDSFKLDQSCPNSHGIQGPAKLSHYLDVSWVGSAVLMILQREK